MRHLLALLMKHFLILFLFFSFHLLPSPSLLLTISTMEVVFSPVSIWFFYWFVTNTKWELLNLGGGIHSIDCCPSFFLIALFLLSSPVLIFSPALSMIPLHLFFTLLSLFELFLRSYLPTFSCLLISSPFSLSPPHTCTFIYFLLILFLCHPSPLLSSPLLLFLFRSSPLLLSSPLLSSHSLPFLLLSTPLLSSHSLPFLLLSSPVNNGRGSDPGSAHRGSGLPMQPTLERCFPASLPAVTSCDFFFFFSPLAVFTPSRGLPSLSPVEDGAPDDPPRSPPPLSRLSAAGVRRGSS